MLFFYCRKKFNNTQPQGTFLEGIVFIRLAVFHYKSIYVVKFFRFFFQDSLKDESFEIKSEGNVNLATEIDGQEEENTAF